MVVDDVHSSISTNAFVSSRLDFSLRKKSFILFNCLGFFGGSDFGVTVSSISMCSSITVLSMLGLIVRLAFKATRSLIRLIDFSKSPLLIEFSSSLQYFAILSFLELTSP